MPVYAHQLDDNNIDNFEDVEDIDFIDVSILDPPCICSGAILTILGIGKHMWQLCKALSEAKKNRLLMHSLANHWTMQISSTMQLQVTWIFWRLAS